MAENQMPAPHKFDVGIKKTHPLKMLTMILLGVVSFSMIGYDWHKQHSETKTKQNKVYVMSVPDQGIQTPKAFELEDRLVNEDCWVSKVMTDRSGKVTTAHYFCFETKQTIISTHYNYERTFDYTKLPVAENLLDEKAAYIKLGEERFCQFKQDSQLCLAKAKQ